MTENSDIIAAIRDARKAKGLSQSELSSRIGVPQSHISKIENGAVDLKLSSLIQIARALDLELKLVPRKSLPAVESIVRSTKGTTYDQTSSALNEIRNAEKLINRINIKDNLLANILASPVHKIDQNLNSLKALHYDTNAIAQLKKALEPIQEFERVLSTIEAAKNAQNAIDAHKREINKFTRASSELAKLRNAFVHNINLADKAHRPAYSFEEGDDE